MENLFLAILNMSLTASAVILVIMLARYPLKKAPRFISYALWAVAGFRLTIPFSFEAAFSLLPIRSAPIATDIGYQSVPRIDTGIEWMDETVSGFLPAATPAASVNPLQIWLAIGTFVWIAGVAAMLVHCVVSLISLKRGLAKATLHSENIYELPNLKTPFVIGIVHPQIYLPAGLSGDERNLILLHEQTHIARRDPVIKMIAYLILCLHWFNPLAWIAFLQMSADQETSCDERVLKELGGENKALYAKTLVSFAVKGRLLNGSPLAFGEGGMKGRVKNVLSFRKIPRVAVVAAITLALALTVGLAANRASEPLQPEILTPHDLEGTPFSSEQSAQVVREVSESLLRNDTSRLQAAIRTGGLDVISYSVTLGLTDDYGDRWRVNESGEKMTLENLRAIMDNAQGLSMKDFKQFTCHYAIFWEDKSVYHFAADDQYILTVVADLDGNPLSVKLESAYAAAGSGVEILDGGLEAFLATFPRFLRAENVSNESSVSARLKVPSFTTAGLIVEIDNSTDDDYTYQYAYRLETGRSGASWREMKRIDETSAEKTLPRSIKAGSPINVAVDWGKTYDELSSGEYRIAMDFTYKSEQGGAVVNDTLYVYFTIGDI